MHFAPLVAVPHDRVELVVYAVVASWIDLVLVRERLLAYFVSPSPFLSWANLHILGGDIPPLAFVRRVHFAPLRRAKP